MDIEMVERVVGLLNVYPVAEITLEQDGAKVSVRRSSATPFAGNLPALVPAALLPEDVTETVTEAEAVVIDPEPVILGAPMVGLFHHLAAPIRYGGSIASGQLVGHIESMKLMNDVLADEGGRILEVLVEDGAAVEYGQPLFRLGPKGE